MGQPPTPGNLLAVDRYWGEERGSITLRYECSVTPIDGPIPMCIWQC